MRYRHISITSLAALAVLTRTLAAPTRTLVTAIEAAERPLGTLVLDLTITSWDDPPPSTVPDTAGDVAPGDQDEAADVWTLLDDLFDELPRLESLKIVGNDGSSFDDVIFDVVLCDSFTPRQLCALRTPTLQSRSSSIAVGGPDDARTWLHQINKYTKLRKLVLILDPNGGDALSAVFRGASSHERPVLAHLWSLDVEANFDSWTAPLGVLTPNLIRLKVVAKNSSLRAVVQGAPPDLAALDITVASLEPDQLALEFDTLNEHFVTFPTLSYLRLNSSDPVAIETPSPIQFFADPIILKLDGAFALADRVLSGVVHAPRRLKRLRLVTFDGCYAAGVVGPTMESKGWALPGDGEHNSCGVWEGWAYPEETDCMSLQELAISVMHGSAHGIKFLGTTTEAFTWMSEYLDEVYLTAFLRGLLTGEWDDADRLADITVSDEWVAKCRASAGKAPLIV